jgi:uncharacterized membrane protein
MGFELASNWHPVLAVLAVIVLTVVVYACYYRNIKALPRRNALLLLVLRVAVVVFLFLCILKPVLSYQSIAGEKTRLVFLVDNSQSMTLPLKDAQGRKPRLDVARNLVSGPEGLPGPLGRSFAVQTFTFSGSPTQHPPDEMLEKLTGEGNVTAIVESLRKAATKSGTTAPAAAVIITDGADNSAAGGGGRALGFPIFAVGVGSRLSESGVIDILLGAPKAPEEAYKNTTIQVEIEVKAVGLKAPSRHPVTLCGPEGEMLAAGDVTLSDEKPSESLTLSFIAESPGIFEYTISVPELKNEYVKENNRQSFTVHVLDSKLRVLLVDRARWEYKYLKLILEQDPNVQFTGAVLTQKNQFTLQGAGRADLVARGLPVDVSGYENWDIVILGELAREAFASQQLEALKSYVAQGGGFCALGGRSALGKGGYGGTAIEEILPVALGGRGAGEETGTFVMQLTRDGKRHPIMQGITSYFERAQDSGCVLGSINVTGKRKPGAIVLAEHPDMSIEGEPLAVVAVARYGEGKTMIVTGSTTYKWHLKYRGLGLDSPYVRFWGQAVRWLAGVKGPDSGGLFAIWTDRRNYSPGQTVHINVRLDSERMKQPLPDSLVVQAEVENHVQPVYAQAKGDGRHYEGEFTPSKGGQYEISSSVTDREGKTEQKSVGIAVGRRFIEFENPDLNDELLRRIAADSGGKYYAYHEASRLLRDIEVIASAHSEEREVSIWDTPLFFLLFLVLATAEWVLRKRNMLI